MGKWGNREMGMGCNNRCCNGKGVVMAGELQWQGSCNDRGIAMAGELQWQGSCNGRRVAMAGEWQ